ncbi:DNA polymerase III, partial [Candidatus Peribacteria bacterium]|nr:DNA polymerase III [Candidatus Peribacteria bacterium]
LSAENLRRAKEKGVRICISSDAHAPQGLQYHYGILQARRAWLEQKDFINMQPWHTFNAWRTKRQASS